MSEEIYPHLYRWEFTVALATGGPAERPLRRFLMVLTAMADQWSLILPNCHVLAGLFSIRVNTVREWLEQLQAEQWLSAVPETDLSLVHLPEGSAAYQAGEPAFEWHSRSHAPVSPFPRARVNTTPVKRQGRSGPIPLTARALQLAAGSAGKTRKGQYAYISFVNHSLSPQPQNTDAVTRTWDRYLPQDY